jgi:hypothetical protein
MHLIKPGLRHQDLEGIHLPSLRFSWKLKKLCRDDFFVFESWQTAEDVMVLPCDLNLCRHLCKLHTDRENRSVITRKTECKPPKVATIAISTI